MPISHSIPRALGYLERAAELRRSTPLVQAAVLAAIAGIPEAERVAKDLAKNLTQTITAEWVSTAEFTTVFLALYALQAHTGQTVSGELLASAAKRLIDAEQSVGGPYCVRPGVCDPVANAQVALFAQQAAGKLPKVDSLLSKEFTADLAHGSDFSPEATRHYIALAIGQPLQPYMSAEPQSKDGSWPAKPFRTYPDMVASPLITTALHVQALHKAQPSAAGDKIRPNDAKNSRQTYRAARSYLKYTPASMRSSLTHGLSHIAQADTNHEIALLPQYFAHALRSKPDNLTDDTLRQLGAANIYCWLAYTIFDDIFDEQKDTDKLPVATTAHRLSLRLYREAVSDHAFIRYCEKVCNDMDSANAWELAHARFKASDEVLQIEALPDYRAGQQLAQRSFAHALGPMAILTAANVPIGGPAWRHIEAGFRHYLVARQLSDDLHDWQDDLRAGAVTFVVTHLLSTAGVGQGRHAFDTLVPQLQQTLQTITIHKVATVIRKHLKAAHKAFAASGLLTQSNALTELLDRIEQNTSHSLTMTADQKAFIAAFK